MAIKISQDLINHYKLEKLLANRIKTSSWPERGRLYSDSYSEIYKKIPNHPLLNPLSQDQVKNTERQFRVITKFLQKKTTFCEIGPGNCALLFKVADIVSEAYGVDVSLELSKELIFPDNAQLLLSDGRNIPLPNNSVDIAYSHQFIEHLHPDDGLVHLKNVYRILKNNGMYICITPSKLSGPHDISRYFDKVATCFHLKEYSIIELSKIMREVGFSKIRYIFRIKNLTLFFPILPSLICEKILELFPFIQKILARRIPFRWFIDVRLIGYK
jgi:SAM-dependent methyltransferase